MTLPSDPMWLTRSTRQILTANLPRKCRLIRTLRVLCFRRPCNSNLLAGPTIAQLLVLGMLEGASRIHHLGMSMAKRFCLDQDTRDDSQCIHVAASIAIFSIASYSLDHHLFLDTKRSALFPRAISTRDTLTLQRFHC